MKIPLSNRGYNPADLRSRKKGLIQDLCHLVFRPIDYVRQTQLKCKRQKSSNRKKKTKKKIHVFFSYFLEACEGIDMCRFSGKEHIRDGK